MRYLALIWQRHRLARLRSRLTWLRVTLRDYRESVEYGERLVRDAEARLIRAEASMAAKESAGRFMKGIV